MAQVLLITSSPRGGASHSTRLAQSLAERLTAREPGSTLVVRDLEKDPLPHIGQEFIGALFTPPENLTPAQKAALQRSDELISELLAAGTVVIASAMINFSLSTNLKTYIDHIVRVGRTFKYSEQGRQGLVTGKKAYLVRAAGGVYSDDAARSIDFQEPYLKHILNFIGITDVEVVSMEGLAYGPEATDKALAEAAARVSALAGAAV